MITDYRDSHLAPGKGDSYNRQFYENPHRSMIWRLEKDILNQFVQQFYKARKIRHLDFACGTGRILEFLENRTIESVGVDLSPSMLDVARRKSERSEIIEADITRTDVLGDRKFNLITAFRFFPNAQPELRLEAMRTLIGHLDDDGYIVFNNHKNLSSLRNRLARMFNRGRTSDMDMAAVKSFIETAGLEIEKIYHIGIIPSTEDRLLLPRHLHYSLEKVLSSSAIVRNFAQNHIFVCKHNRAANHSVRDLTRSNPCYLAASHS